MTSNEPKRPPTRCHVCEASLKGATKCPSCGASVAYRDVKLPGPAEPNSLGSYGKIKYHDR